MSDAQYSADADVVKWTAEAAFEAGEVVQLPDGRAGVITGLEAIASGDEVAAKVSGIVTVTKTASICFLAGGRVFWDRSADAAHFRPLSGDFYLGTVAKDAASAATTMTVDLNAKQVNLIDFDGSPGETLWTHSAALGQGVTAATPAARCKLAFDAVAEVARAALYPTETAKHVPIGDSPILEMKIACYNVGDDAALDVNFGLANGSHDTDFDSVTEFVGFHVDGAALDLKAESDDGTTEVAATDTTVNLADDTYVEVWIDCRDLDDIQLYVDGVNVLPDSVFKLDAATGPMFPIVHLEKTSNDTVADYRVEFIKLRPTDLAE